MAKTPRTWTGARTPSGLKRVRQAQSRHEVLQPRRTAAKTFVAKALSAAAQPADSTIDPIAALAEALSALDRAAKVGAIHPNAAARRKSRLTIKVNAALGGERVATGGRVVKTTGKAAAAKAAKARIAAGKAGKAKGAQTAAGKARAALSKTARAEAAAAKAAAAEASADDPPRPSRPQRRRRPRPRQDDQDGRQEARGDQGRPEGHRQGRSQEDGLDQEVGSGHSRRHQDAPGLPGRFDSGPGLADASRGGGPASAIASGFGRKTPYRPAPPRPPSAVSTRTVPALPNCSRQ